ncbi:MULTISPECIES: DUF6281 family protein [Streptomyces]|uniref:DUF6281 family protein n=1 Tax=Streptomyces griseiscabiei TaxID=2993540 RepID=A0ABU4KWJ6_9ACTN|nr:MULTISPECIES: DUF6281 family protein [Streptomyces]MBZ3903357.1 hypothetical protein [Streptomyces griseiscabiei]MDX2907668.1 DUF6281 family protein [Streptomyces griseiscabiei]
MTQSQVAVATASEATSCPSAACAVGVQFDGELYTRVSHRDFTVGDTADGAQENSCDDTGDGSSDPTDAQSFTAYRIEELDEGTAVAVKDSPANPDREDGPHLYVQQQDGGHPKKAKEFLDSGR